jgi:hypothetical protein
MRFGERIVCGVVVCSGTLLLGTAGAQTVATSCGEVPAAWTRSEMAYPYQSQTAASSTSVTDAPDHSASADFGVNRIQARDAFGLATSTWVDTFCITGGVGDGVLLVNWQLDGDLTILQPLDSYCATHPTDFSCDVRVGYLGQGAFGSPVSSIGLGYSGSATSQHVALSGTLEVPFTYGVAFSGGLELTGSTNESGGSLDFSHTGSVMSLVLPAGASLEVSSGASYPVTHVAGLYAFSGFFQPVVGDPALNQVHPGSSVPLKFSLAGDQGLDIFEPGYPRSTIMSCADDALSNTVFEAATSGQSALSYDPSSDQYIYVWKTQPSWKGTCRQLTIKLNDGSVHTANFDFRR